eukprot:674833-Amphidinium_carterae.1
MPSFHSVGARSWFRHGQQGGLQLELLQGTCRNLWIIGQQEATLTAVDHLVRLRGDRACFA